jgi:hypothetical protein
MSRTRRYRDHEYPWPGLIRRTFPLRDNVTAELVLPTDLRIDEVRRLVAFLELLVVRDAA